MRVGFIHILFLILPIYLHNTIPLFLSHNGSCLDHAETRRGKASVNQVWNSTKSTFAGDYVIAVCSKLIARTDNQVA